jgi:hypothetical protein
MMKYFFPYGLSACLFLTLFLGCGDDSVGPFDLMVKPDTHAMDRGATDGAHDAGVDQSADRAADRSVDRSVDRGLDGLSDLPLLEDVVMARDGSAEGVTDSHVDRLSDVPSVDFHALDAPRDVVHGDLLDMNLDALSDLATTDADAYTGEAGPPPGNQLCQKPSDLSLQSGHGTLSADTSQAQNEFGSINCSGDLSDILLGPQLYYRVHLEGGKLYKAVVTGSFDVALYAFLASTSCSAIDINLGCKTPLPKAPERIYSSDNFEGGTAEVVRLAPTADEDWIVVVGSYSSLEKGSFTLTISEVIPVANDTCTAPEDITLVNGKATVSGSTDLALNEFGSSITCSGPAPFRGGQLYYRIAIPQGEGLHLSLSPTFTASLYVFSEAASCLATAINQECGSAGVNGSVLEVIGAGTTGPLVFSPSQGGNFIVAVDAIDPVQAGYFQLVVETFSPMAHDKCSSPKSITLSSSPTVLSQSTALASNEFGTTIKCGLSYDFDGPQLYYLLSLEQSKTYTIEVTPTGWDVVLYLFTDTTCDPATINSQCLPTQMHADGFYIGEKETLTISPSVSMSYILAVDTWSPDQKGAFSLSISWQ